MGIAVQTGEPQHETHKAAHKLSVECLMPPNSDGNEGFKGTDASMPHNTVSGK